MKIMDERIQLAEVRDLTEELVENLSQALSEDFGLMLSADEQQYLQKEVVKILAKFFSVK